MSSSDWTEGVIVCDAGYGYIDDVKTVDILPFGDNPINPGPSRFVRTVTREVACKYSGLSKLVLVTFNILRSLLLEETIIFALIERSQNTYAIYLQ